MISSQGAELRSAVRSTRSHLMQARLEALKRYSTITFSLSQNGYNATNSDGNVLLFSKKFPRGVSAVVSSENEEFNFTPLGVVKNKNGRAKSFVFDVKNNKNDSVRMRISAAGNIKVMD
ncbi:hypothetical protein Dret_1699 [Desulfohalobium retbaense DSM 5692]|uniref:General secretion pathway GspH domain-containing protein n=2 Tax=Desulfohalobium TaxID=45662 RepID=C8X3I6_DESRD|nr:hypothetical protein Dret_1699 [Desulfohalobium retbaense DSM 5692]